MNTFGDTSYRYPLYDAREAVESRVRFRRDAVPLLRHANSLYVPCGHYATHGWILLSRKDYNQLDRYSTTLQLEIGDATRPNNTGIFKNLAIVQAQCVTRGLADDPNALYLIELTDARGVLQNRWFQFPITTQYNIRAPGYPQTFLLESMDDYPTAGVGSKTTWTWSRMLQDMWERMPLLGTWPGLPFFPQGTPEGFWFTGVPALDALCGVLDHLGLTIACDLTQANPFTIVSEGADDAVFTALQAKYTTHLEDDQEWIDVGSGRVPSTVSVLFRRRNSVYGTEETVAYRNDVIARQWNMQAVYTVSVAAPSLFTDSAGVHYLWSDFTVRYDDSGNPLDEDIHTARQIAVERVTQYFGRIYSLTNGYMSQTYAGALPFTTGSQVDGVCWRMGYNKNHWHGWQTLISRVGGGPPFPGVWDQV